MIRINTIITISSQHPPGPGIYVRLIVINHQEILVAGVGSTRYQRLQLSVSWVRDNLAFINKLLTEITVNQRFAVF